MPDTPLQIIAMSVAAALFVTVLVLIFFLFLESMIKAPPAADLPPLPAKWKMCLGAVVLAAITVLVFRTIHHDLTANVPRTTKRFDDENKSVAEYQSKYYRKTNHYKP